METTMLGRTNLSVSRSGFGALPIQRISKPEAAALLRKAYDGGINFFDTARAYTDSEEKIARGLSAVRQNIIIASKTAATTPEGFWSDLDTSLKTLKTDYIDIYQFHNIEEVPTKGSPLYNCMAKAKKSGKICFIGITAHKLGNAEKAMKSGLYDTIQYPLSALSSEEEIAFAAQCARHNIGVIGMKALCGGLLTSAKPTMAFLRPHRHIVPIWGFQRESELDEVLRLEKTPPEMDGEMQETIEHNRTALSGDFCRGCGYCMPCAAGIRINWVARMPQVLRRMPYEQFFTEEWQVELKKVENCTKCGLCEKRCPYGLPVIHRIKEANDDWRAFGKEQGIPIQ